jgi:hypothetical protein
VSSSNGSLRSSSAVAGTGFSQAVCVVLGCVFVNKCNCEITLTFSNEEFLNMLSVYGYCNDNSIAAVDADIDDDFHSEGSEIGMCLVAKHSNG